MAPLLADLDPSIVPARTADPAEAARLMREQGACVLTGLGSGQVAADGLARLVLGDRVVAAPESIAVREGGDKDRKVRDEAAHEVPLPMHTDGFTYGHDAPDAMFLLCDVDSAIGGESVLIDDYAVLAALRAEPAGSAGARLADFVTGTVLDLTSPGMVERSGTMVAAHAGGAADLLVGRPARLHAPHGRRPRPRRHRRPVRRRHRAVRAAAAGAPGGSGSVPARPCASTTTGCRTPATPTSTSIASSGGCGRGATRPSPSPTASSPPTPATPAPDGPPRRCERAVNRVDNLLTRPVPAPTIDRREHHSPRHRRPHRAGDRHLRLDRR